MALGKTKIRRRKVRRQKAERTASLVTRLGHSIGLWPASSFMVFACAAAAVALYGRQSSNYVIGQRIDQPIVARVDFEWIDTVGTEKNRRDAMAAAPNCYRVNHALISDLTLSIQTLYQDRKASESFSAFEAKAKEKGWMVEGPDLYGDLGQLMDEAGSQRFSGWVDRLRTLLAASRTFHPPDSAERNPRASGLSVVIIPTDPSQPEDQERVEPLTVSSTRLIPIVNPDLIDLLAGSLVSKANFPLPVVRGVVQQMLSKRLSAEPLLVYDASLTTEGMQKATEAIKQATITFKAGLPIVTPALGGVGLFLTAEDLARLGDEDQQYHKMLASHDQSVAPLRDQLYLERAGVVVIIVILSLALFIHVGLYQPRIFEVRMRTMALMALLLGMLVLARVLEVRFQRPELVLLPALVSAACLSIAYARRFALGTMVIASLLVVMTLRSQIDLLMIMWVGASVAVYLLSDVRTRTQIINTGFLTSIAVGITTLAFGLVDKQTWAYVGTSAAYAASSALAAALVVQGILPFIERGFRMATSLTLLEWSSADRPLLQRLAREAPGTYNHSLILGTIGEAACESIGANGLLLRVGALYHDAGKIHKADYFAENQEASINRHDNLSASMSLLIILGHVKDGVELAREYGLPRVLYPFIEEHHGTTVVRYFHHKASEQQQGIASGKHDRDVAESEFRYPGPKPRSKETAVLMICDGVEGAVRALPEPTAARIEGVVSQIITDRLNDGQFGECDITLKELRIVEESVVKSLCTFYHGRVAYPKGSPSKSPAQKDERDQVGTESAKQSASATGEVDQDVQMRRA